MNSIASFIAAISMVVVYGAYCVWRAWRKMPPMDASDERVDQYLQAQCPEYKRRRAEAMKEL